MTVATIVDDIQAKRAEQTRLLDTLKFYEWLEDHGLSWDVIQGIRPIEGRGPYGRIGFSEWNKMSPEMRKRYKGEQRTIRRLIDFKLKDGSIVVLPWPPFDDDVIYNRKRYPMMED